MKERLQKAIASSGIASRRQAENLISQGNVTVNGHIVTKQGLKVDIDKDSIKVNGKSIIIRPSLRYILLYKPKQVITTLNDPQNRKTVIDLIKGVKGRLVPVGRLDYNSEGLILLSNDGELANRLMHPKYMIKKVYSIKVKGIPGVVKINKLKNGIYIDRKVTVPLSVTITSVKDKNTWMTITISEGRNRIIRKMCDRIGHPVLKLIRISYAFLDLTALKPGMYRNLMPEEISRLRAICKL